MSILTFLKHEAFEEQNLRQVKTKCHDESYRGVSLTRLNAIAQTCQVGSFVFVNEGELVYRYKSGRGHMTYDARFRVVNHQLEPMTFGHYPGQRHFPDLDFMDQANTQFEFK